MIAILQILQAGSDIKSLDPPEHGRHVVLERQNHKFKRYRTILLLTRVAEMKDSA